MRIGSVAWVGLVLWACDPTGEKEPAGCPDEAGVICTFAGDGEAAFDGDGNPLLASSLYWPIDITFANGTGYIVDWNNHRVRQIQSDGTLQTVLGTDFLGDGPDDLSDLTPPGAPGTSIHLNHPTQVLPQPNGKLLMVSWHNHKIREWDPETGLAVVTCGGPAGFTGDGGPVRTALLNQPISIDRGVDGSLFLLDQRNQVIRRMSPDGMMSTVAGRPTESGFEGDGGSPRAALMNQPKGTNPPPGGGLVVDRDGVIYFADTLNHRIRKVDLAADTIETVAGDGTAGFGGDGGPGTAAQLNNPRKLTLHEGTLYIGDELNHRIRALDLATGTIRTVVGNGSPGYTGDGGPATAASVYRPAGVTIHGQYMYVIDTYNHVIRRVRL